MCRKIRRTRSDGPSPAGWRRDDVARFHARETVSSAPLSVSSTAVAIRWRIAAVVAVRTETPRTKTLVLDVPGWPGHRAGQRVDIRLTAEDGYQAQRSYSIASAPEHAGIE